MVKGEFAEIGARRTGASPALVAFALETGGDDEVLAYAKNKLAQKRVDLVVANAAHESLGKSTNRIAFVGKGAIEPFLEADKETVADRILDRVARLLRPAG